MSDPTELVIVTTFSAALLVFALAAVVRNRTETKSIPEPTEAEPDFSESGILHPDSPPPAPTAGRVATWFYQPLDLLGVGFIFVLFYSLALASARASGKGGGEQELDPGGLLGSIAFQFVGAGIVTFFVIPRIGPVAWLGLKWPSWRRIFLIAPCSVFAMWLFFAGLQVVGLMEWIKSLGVETVQETVKLLQEADDPIVIGLMTFAAIVAAPLCEEIIFRGYLYPATKKFSGPWVAGICSALVFAAAHGSLAALLPLFVFGCLLVFLYEKTGSLWAPIGVHFLFNSATVMVEMIARHYPLPVDAAP